MNETSGLTRRQIEINLFSQQLSTITRCHLYLVARLLDKVATFVEFRAWTKLQTVD